MALDPDLKDALRLPVVAAPMTAVTGPELVAEAMKAGVMGALPRQNASSLEEFESWLAGIRRDTAAHRDAHPDAVIGPLAVNLTSTRPPSEYRPELDLCARYGVEVIINAMGDPAELTKMVHDWGGRIFHDVTTYRFVEKALAAGVDGMTCIVGGGGGHSGVLSPFVFVPQVRRVFDGTILLAGAIAHGAAVRAAEVLGADLAYLGTRFIATRESRVDPDYRRFIVESTAADLVYTSAITAVPANWLRRSLEHVGLDPDDPPVSAGRGTYGHLPEGVRPWHNIWSAGQGIELINDIPTVAELVRRLRAEYVAACETPSMIEAARLAEAAQKATV